MSVEDLSKYHHAVTDIFLPLNDGENFALSHDQIEFFHENGYLSGIKILNDAQIKILREELTRLMNPGEETQNLFYEFHHNESENPEQILFHALGAWRVSKAFHDLLWNPRFTVAASQLLGDQNGGGAAVRFWHDQIFVKPARYGGVVAWHQDYSYWTRSVPQAHLTCWIGLDDSTRENGCLHYVPKSHRWNLLPRGTLANDMNAVFDVLNEKQKREFQPVAIELNAGEASFHHPLMLHGSYQNSSEKPRRATVVNVFRDGVCSASDEPLLEGVPAIRRGKKIDGQFFPLLIDV